MTKQYPDFFKGILKICQTRVTTWRALAEELGARAKGNPRTMGIGVFLRHRSFPVDAHHNAKINREALAVWAQGVALHP